MRVFSLPGREVETYNSRGVLMHQLPAAAIPDQTHVHIAHLEAGGTIGAHPASVPQVFMVIEGEGLVAGSDGIPRPISAGQAALWQTGETHQSWASTAMVVVIVETSGMMEPGNQYPDS